MTHFLFPCLRWPDSPARPEKSRAKRWWGHLHSTMDLPVVRKHAQMDFYEKPVIVITLRTRWLKRKDSDTVIPHLKHKWVFLYFYCRGLHHPKSFTATTNNNLNNEDLNDTGLDELPLQTTYTLHLSSMAYLCSLRILWVKGIWILGNYPPL